MFGRWLGAEESGEGNKGVVERFWAISARRRLITSSFGPVASRFRRTNSSRRKSAVKPARSSGVASLQFTSGMAFTTKAQESRETKKAGRSSCFGSAGELLHRAGGHQHDGRRNKRQRHEMTRTKRPKGVRIGRRTLHKGRSVVRPVRRITSRGGQKATFQAWFGVDCASCEG